MKQYVKWNLVICVLWSCFLITWLLLGEWIMGFNFVQTMLIALAPSVITGGVTYIIAKKSQMKENTAELKVLIERLGLSGEQTLQKQIISGFETISNDIGRRDDASLTRQHQQLEANIEKSFNAIQQRYDKEDNEYRKLSLQQYELKKVLDSFSRDYLEQISQVDVLEKENENLLRQIDELSNQNIVLKNENQRLQEENDVLKYSSSNQYQEFEDDEPEL